MTVKEFYKQFIGDRSNCYVRVRSAFNGKILCKSYCCNNTKYNKIGEREVYCIDAEFTTTKNITNTVNAFAQPILIIWVTGYVEFEESVNKQKVKYTKE